MYWCALIVGSNVDIPIVIESLVGTPTILKYPPVVSPAPVTCIPSLTLLIIPVVGTPIDAPAKFSGNNVSPPA